MKRKAVHEIRKMTINIWSCKKEYIICQKQRTFEYLADCGRKTGGPPVEWLKQIMKKQGRKGSGSVFLEQECVVDEEMWDMEVKL